MKNLKTKTLVTTALLCLFFGSLSFAQMQELNSNIKAKYTKALSFSDGFAIDSIIFEKTYNISEDDIPSDIIQTKDGSFILVGYSGTWRNRANMRFDLTIIKLDKNGNLLWKKVFGINEIGSCKLLKLIETDKGELLLVGTKYLNPGRKQIALIIKLDSSGNILWNKTYEGESFSNLVSIIPISSNKYLAFGMNPGKLQLGLWLLLIDENGNNLADSQLPFIGKSEPKQLLRVSDGGFLITGNYLTSDYKCLVDVKRYNTKFEREWVKEFNFDYEAYAVENADGFIIAANNMKTKRLNLTRLNKSGEVTWEKKFTAKFTSITPANNNEFYILSSKKHNDDFSPILWLFKMNKDGKIVWETTIKDNPNNTAKKIITTHDGGIVIFGKNKTSNYDFWIVKLKDNSGNNDKSITKYLEDKKILFNDKLLTREELRKEKFYKSFDEALEEPEKVYKLSIIYSKNNEKLIEVLNKCKNLQIINLLNCNITEIPNELFEIKNLQYLFLDHNNISEIPKDISKLKNLKLFSIKHNKLTKLPKCLSKLKKLELFFLHDNNISETDIEKLKKSLPDCKISY